MTFKTLKSLKYAICAAMVFSFPQQNVAAQTYGNSAKLPDIIVNAYSHHPQLKSLRAELYGTREGIVQARAAFLPQVSANGGISIADRDAVLRTGADFSQNNEPTEIAVQVEQTIFDGGRRRLVQENASIEFQISEAQYEEAAIAIAAEIIEDYINLMSAIAEVEILDDSVTALEQLEKSVIARRKVGDSTKTELAQAVSRLASSRAQRAAARAQLNLARDQLLSKTGFLVQTPELPIEATTQILLSKLDLAERARQLNPSIRATRLMEQSTLNVVKTEKRSFLPTVTLSAQAQALRDSSPTIDNNDTLSVGVNFSVPLYAGGAGSSRTRQALAERNAAKYNTLNVIRQNDLVINQLWAELESGKIVLEAQKANVDANIDAVEGITRGEAVGISTTQDVLEAIQDKLSADLNYSEAQYDLYITRLLLKLYIGQFDVYKFE